MKKILLSFLLVSSLSLAAGCQKKTERTMIALPSSSAPSSQESAPSFETEIPVVQTEINKDLPPSEGMVKSPLTNQWVSSNIGSMRPLAVMVPNDSSALPHYNLSKADILYECLVEGNITRLMAVYGDWTSLERVGNLRSCRDYFVYWAFEWDAIYVHAGGPFYINDVINRSDTQNIDALTSPEGVFYRTTDRSAPQNLYFDGEDLFYEAGRKGYPLTPRETHNQQDHFLFASHSEPNTLEQYPGSADAKAVYLKDAYPVTGTWFEYNESDGLYYRFQNTSNGAHMDAATGKQLSFKNVLVQFTYHEVRDAQGYLAFQCIDNTRDGWFFTNGKGIHVNWQKTSDYGPTRYFDDYGNEISLNPGKTMICIVQDGDTFSFKNK